MDASTLDSFQTGQIPGQGMSDYAITSPELGSLRRCCVLLIFTHAPEPCEQQFDVAPRRCSRRAFVIEALMTAKCVRSRRKVSSVPAKWCEPGLFVRMMRASEAQHRHLNPI